MPSSFFLTDLAFDPDLSDCVKIYRTTGKFGLGGWIANPVVEIPVSGTVTIADDEALAQVPEGDRVTGSVQFLSPIPIYETLADQPGSNIEHGAISDKIKWMDNFYRVQQVAKWAHYGFWSAILVRIKGD